MGFALADRRVLGSLAISPDGWDNEARGGAPLERLSVFERMDDLGRLEDPQVDVSERAGCRVKRTMVLSETRRIVASA